MSVIKLFSFLPYEAVNNLRVILESDIVYLFKPPCKVSEKKKHVVCVCRDSEEESSYPRGPAMPQTEPICHRGPCKTKTIGTSQILSWSLNMPQSQPLEGAKVECLVLGGVGGGQRGEF